MSFPVISSLDFGISLTFVRFVAAFVFFALVFVPFFIFLSSRGTEYRTRSGSDRADSGHSIVRTHSDNLNWRVRCAADPFVNAQFCTT